MAQRGKKKKKSPKKQIQGKKKQGPSLHPYLPYLAPGEDFGAYARLKQFQQFRCDSGELDIKFEKTSVEDTHLLPIKSPKKKWLPTMVTTHKQQKKRSLMETSINKIYIPGDSKVTFLGWLSDLFKG